MGLLVLWVGVQDCSGPVVKEAGVRLWIIGTNVASDVVWADRGHDEVSASPSPALTMDKAMDRIANSGAHHGGVVGAGVA
jgi:hypothetical protein